MSREKMKALLNPQITIMVIRLSIAIAGLALAALGISHVLVHAGVSTAQNGG